MGKVKEYYYDQLLMAEFDNEYYGEFDGELNYENDDEEDDEIMICENF